jgi:hypothetical protein
MTYREKLAARAAKARRYRAANPEKKSEQNARYYENNRELCLQANARWRRDNWPLIKIQTKLRRAGLPVPSLSALRANEFKVN